MKRISLLFLALIFCCCTKDADSQSSNIPAEIALETTAEVLVPEERLTLFVDLSQHNLVPQKPKTKSGFIPIPMETLLDWDNQRCLEQNEQTFVEVPFFDNSTGILASIQDCPQPLSEEATAIKKFYIETFSGSTKYKYVVTMIPEMHYSRYHDDFSFLDKGNYSGYILYADLSGNLLGSRAYHGGQIWCSKVIKTTDFSSVDEDTRFITVLPKTIQTKTNEGGYIAAAICIGITEPNWLDPAWCFGSYNRGGRSGNRNNGGAGSGASGMPDLQSADDAGPILFPSLPNGPEPSYIIDLSTNLPDYVDMDGSGVYVSGTKISIDKRYVHLPIDVEFSHWTGGFAKYKTHTFLHTVTDNIIATAYFDEIKPCTDTLRNITNPLHEMSVASSSSWGNYYGGTFGETRTKWEDGKLVPRTHNGLDLYADSGTPIFAMYSGSITELKTQDTSDTGYGNRIWIKSTMPGTNTFSILYAHLNKDNAIAINPRTGLPFAVGDQVFFGDLIGYTGKTGNAYNVPSPHLHLGVKVNGEWVNPVDYINGTINTSTINTTQGSIDNIICH